MNLFNALQLAVINVSSPIWLNLLHNASFPLHMVAFWIGLIVAAATFVWSVTGFLETIE